MPAPPSPHEQDGRPVVVRAITRLNIGGPARQALLLSRDLAGYRTILAAGRPGDDEGELHDPAVPVTGVPLVRPVAPRDDLRALAAMRRLLATTRPALLHTHMAKAGTLGRLAARSLRRRPRTVHTFHGHVLEGYFSAPVERAFLETERRLARHTDVLVAVSEEVRRSILDLGIGTPEQVRVVHLGLELDRHFAVGGRSGVLRGRLGIPDDAIVLGMVGRLVPIKDPITALEAVARVPDVHLAVVGGGELAGELADQIAARGLEGRVHLTGWMDDVPAVMADIDVALLSSRNEGTPVALIEAAACGRPAVATDVGGVASVVQDGVTGLLVPPGDAAALAGGIERLAEDAALRARCGAAARVAAERFRAERLLADIRQLYEELLTGRT